MDEFRQFASDVKRQMKEKKKEFIEKHGIRQLKREINYYKNRTDAAFEPRYTQKLEILDKKIKFTQLLSVNLITGTEIKLPMQHY